MIELDHFFVVARGRADFAEHTVADDTSAIAANCAEILRSAGFCEGSANTHPGQGTANRRFFFCGFMLEFLYVNDPPALRSPAASTLGMTNRFTSPDASLFGIASRSSGSIDSNATYDYVRYKPDYLPDSLHIQVARDIGHFEPLWFHLPFVHAPTPVDEVSRGKDDSYAHENGVAELTGITLETPHVMSESSRKIADSLGVSLKPGSRQCACLEFDDARQGRRVDGLSHYGLRITY